jgi:small glutamine-rich tetratricopeptide repeat-containing protein alpha
MSKRDYEGAISFYNQAIDLSPEGPSTHIFLSNRAAAECHLQRYEDAVASCEESIALNDGYSKAYSRKGMAHLELQEFAEAISAYEKVLELDPKNSTAGDHLAHAKQKLAGGSVPQGMPAGTVIQQAR